MFSEGRSDSDSYKLYVTESVTNLPGDGSEDPDSDPNWGVGNTGRTIDKDVSTPAWNVMRIGDTLPGDSDPGNPLGPQLRIYAGLVP